MNLQDLTYFIAVAEHGHFGKAAQACHVGQPTLSAQLRKMEQELGVTLFERNNRRVAITEVGQQMLGHARRAVAEARLMEQTARASKDQLAGPFRLGVIPTVAPYLMPGVLGALRATCPQMFVELWEDVTAALLDRLREQKLDAVLIATELRESGLTAVDLLDEPFLAALPPGHRLAANDAVKESDLAGDLLVLADGHCLAGQARAACLRPSKTATGADLRASSLETLVNLVAAGYGTTLVPRLAAATLQHHGVVLRPLLGGAGRTLRLASRATFTRPKALHAIAKAVESAGRDLNA